MALDPGALGTLLIGLDHARHEFDPVPEPTRRPARTSRIAWLARSTRTALAAVQRAIARARVPVGESSRP